MSAPASRWFRRRRAGRRRCGGHVLGHGRDEHVAAAGNGRDEIVLAAALLERLAQDRDVPRQVVIDDSVWPDETKEVVLLHLRAISVRCAVPGRVDVHGRAFRCFCSAKSDVCESKVCKI